MFILATLFVMTGDDRSKIVKEVIVNLVDFDGRQTKDNKT